MLPKIMVVGVAAFTAFLIVYVESQTISSDLLPLYNCYKGYISNPDRLNQTFGQCEQNFKVKIAPALNNMPFTAQHWKVILEAMNAITWCFLNKVEHECEDYDNTGNGVHPHLLYRAVKDAHCSQAKASKESVMLANICNSSLTEEENVLSWQAELCKKENLRAASEDMAQCANIIFSKLGGPRTTADITAQLFQKMGMIQKEEVCGTGGSKCLALTAVAAKCGAELARRYHTASRKSMGCVGKPPTTTTTPVPGETVIEIVERLASSGDPKAENKPTENPQSTKPDRPKKVAIHRTGGASNNDNRRQVYDEYDSDGNNALRLLTSVVTLIFVTMSAILVEFI